MSDDALPKAPAALKEVGVDTAKVAPASTATTDGEIDTSGFYFVKPTFFAGGFFYEDGFHNEMGCLACGCSCLVDRTWLETINFYV